MNVRTQPTPFLVERYSVARRIWAVRSLRAHDGFPDKGVPAQTWAEWFEWAYGMKLEDYAAMAKEGDHAGIVEKMGGGVPLFDYKLGDRWLIMLGVMGDTVEAVEARIKRQWPEITEVRLHV